MSKKINFEIEDGEIIDDPSQSEFATAKLKLFSSGENRHGMYCDEDTLVSTSNTAYEKPIIFEIINGDFGSHSDKNIPAGFIVPNSAEFHREEDGRLSLSVFAKIWKRYSGKFVDIFLNKNKSKSKLSVEMIMDESEDREDGLIGMKKFYYTAATVLGQFITEASPGANIEMLSFAYDEAYKKEFAFDKYSELDFQIPDGVKKSSKEGIDNYEKFGKGGNSVSLAHARFMLRETKATPDKIKAMYKKLSHYCDMSLDTDDEKTRYALWGGNAGLVWSKELYSKIKEIENKKNSYFAEVITMPYKNIADINPSLKGINPPISLGQANAIAKQADAIGSDEEKNGWAIAISSFKKNHVVKDGRWVEKSDMSKEFAKEDLGKGNAIEIDKSKESMSTSGWGNVDKTSLMHKVLGASNYKTLVRAVYAKVDEGWEDHPSSSLHYPIMQIIGDKAVYNRYGLSQALLRAKAQDEGGVVSKVEGIYGKMGLDKPDAPKKEGKEDMSVKKKQFEIEEEKKDADEEKVEGEKEEMAETPAEEKEESPEEEKSETPDEEKEEQMSLDGYLDLAFLLKLLEKETEGEADFLEEQDGFAVKYAVEELKKDGEKSFEVVSRGMFAKLKSFCNQMEKMSESNRAFMTQFEEMKKFKESIEGQKFSYEIDTTLSEVVGVMPPEEIEKFRSESVNFSLSNVEEWKNSVKAKAFTYVKTEDKKEKHPIKKWAFEINTTQPKDSLWKK